VTCFPSRFLEFVVALFVVFWFLLGLFLLSLSRLPSLNSLLDNTTVLKAFSTIKGSIIERLPAMYSIFSTPCLSNLFRILIFDLGVRDLLRRPDTLTHHLLLTLEYETCYDGLTLTHHLLLTLEQVVLDTLNVF